MKVIILAAAVGLASASNILPRAPAAPKDLCCFTLTANAEGLGSAIVEEDTIGQNRIYSTYPDGYYCISPAEPGKLYDQGGRTCIISKITQQFQCTQGLTTEVDFTVNADGDFQADGSDRFLACLAGGNGNNADGSYLIYSNTRPVGYADKCLEINLSTTGNKCAAEAPVEPTHGNTTTIPIYDPETTTTIDPSAPSATPTDALLCPALTLIDGFYRAPALIIPVSPEAPDAAYGTQFVAQITPGNSTLFSFDIPADWEGSTCSLIFTFPTQENTAFPDAWKYAGRDAKIEFSKLNGTTDQSVTYATKPAVEKSYGQTAIVPGGEYRIDTRSCLAGSRCTFEAKAYGETAIEYFQATGPKAIGLWITRC